MGFLSGICVPCYSLLEKLIPESKPLLDGVQRNLERWTEIAAEKKALKEEREKIEEQIALEKKRKAEEAAKLEITTIPNGPTSQDASPNDDAADARLGSPSQTQEQSQEEEEDVKVDDEENETKKIPPTIVPASPNSNKEITNGVKS